MQNSNEYSHLLKLATSTEYKKGHVFNNCVYSCEFWILHLEKLLNLPHENLVNILGGHGIGINIHGCQPSV